MRRYLEILRTRPLGRLFAASLLARLPIGINGLAVVLFLKQETGQFGTAGAAAGAIALGTGLGAPFTSRLVDRHGPRSLLVLAAAHAAALLGIVVLAPAGAPAGALIATSLAAGAALPPASSVLREQYPRVLGGRPALLQGAFALDSVLTEVLFTAGPLLTAALLVLAGPPAALVVSAVAAVAGTAALVAALPRDREPERPGAAGGRLGALAAPGIRTLAASMLPVGCALGALEVALPAFASEAGRPELAGVLIAVWSLGSLAGGLAYGARPRRASLRTVHLRVAALLPLSFLPMAAASSPMVMALLSIPAGVLIAPLIATRNELAGEVAPAGTGTEAYAWPLTALVGGIALGAASAGALADAAGWQYAVLGASVAAAVGAAISASRRATLVLGHA